MREWQIDALGSIASIRRGIGYSEATLEENREDGSPYLNMKSFIKDGGYNKKGLKFFSGHFTKSDVTTVNDLIIANTDVTPGGDIIGVPALLPKALASDTVLFSHHVTRLHINGQIETPFLYYLLCTDRYRRSMRKYARGTTVQMLDMAGIKRIPVSYPKSRNVQQQIIAILTTIDTAIEQTEALIEKYQHIKAGLMHDLFTRGVLPTGQLRPPREHVPELYKETAIGWIPREWQTGQIGTYFEIQLGKMLNQLARTGRNSFPYLGNRSVQWNRLQMDNLESMDFSPEEQKKFALKDGDLLVCEGGEVGRTAIWASQMENCFYQKAIHRLRGKHEGINPRFMLWYMHVAQANGQFSDFTSQSSIAHLTQEKLAKVPALLPPTPEQDLIVSCIDAHETVVEGQRDYLANLRAQKLGLMQDLLTGKVAVNVNAEAVGDTSG